MDPREGRVTELGRPGSLPSHMRCSGIPSKGVDMRTSALLGAVIASFLMGATAISIASVAKVTEPEEIRVVERALHNTVTDTGAAGDTAGDLLTFANPIYQSGEQIGRDQGDCIRIDPAEGKWECRWITYVGGGGITVEGPFYDSKDSTMAITGGTGRFQNARGTMHLHALSATKFQFTFSVIP
jgi:allene oxide cyclase